MRAYENKKTARTPNTTLKHIKWPFRPYFLIMETLDNLIGIESIWENMTLTASNTSSKISSQPLIKSSRKDTSFPNNRIDYNLVDSCTRNSYFLAMQVKL